MWKFLKNIIGGLSTFEDLRGILTSPWLYPYINMAIAAVLAHLQAFPRLETFLAALAAFALTSIGVLSFEIWRRLRTPEHKLQIRRGKIAADYTRPVDGQPAQLLRVQAIGVVENTAPFPISIVVENVDSEIVRRIDGRIERVEAAELASFPITALIGPGQPRELRASQLEISHLPVGETLEGKLSYRLRYGHSGRERFAISEQVKFMSYIDAKTGRIFNVTWGHEPEPSRQRLQTST